MLRSPAPAPGQTGTQIPSTEQEQAAQEPKPSSAVGGHQPFLRPENKPPGAEAKLSRGRTEKSQTTAAPQTCLSHPGATAGNGSGAMTLFTRSPWWGVVGDATATTARTDHSLSPWWRVAHPVHLLPCCCPAHLTRAEARMAPPMIIGMKSRSPHLDGCGSVERRSPRNTRVDPTRMGGRQPS